MEENLFIKRNIYEYDIYKANISCLLEMREIINKI